MSKPETSKPVCSLIDRLNGPRTRREPARREPSLRRGEERREHRPVVLGGEQAEMPDPRAVRVGRRQAVLLRADPADVAPAAPRDPERRLAVPEPRILAGRQRRPPLRQERRHPGRIVPHQRVRQPDEALQRGAPAHRQDLDGAAAFRRGALPAHTLSPALGGRSRGGPPESRATHGNRAASAAS